jgi:hypothetical protein
LAGRTSEKSAPKPTLFRPYFDAISTRSDRRGFVLNNRDFASGSVGFCQILSGFKTSERSRPRHTATNRDIGYEPLFVIAQSTFFSFQRTSAPQERAPSEVRAGRSRVGEKSAHGRRVKRFGKVRSVGAGAGDYESVRYADGATR